MPRYSRPKHFSNKDSSSPKNEYKHKDIKDGNKEFYDRVDTMRKIKGYENPKDKINTPQEKEKVKKVLHEYKRGDLKTSSGKKVTDKKQAVAIALSEGRKIKDNPRASTKNSDEEPFTPRVHESKEETKRRHEREDAPYGY